MRRKRGNTIGHTHVIWEGLHLSLACVLCCVWSSMVCGCVCERASKQKAAHKSGIKHNKHHNTSLAILTNNTIEATSSLRIIIQAKIWQSSDSRKDSRKCDTMPVPGGMPCVLRAPSYLAKQQQFTSNKVYRPPWAIQTTIYDQIKSRTAK